MTDDCDDDEPIELDLAEERVGQPEPERRAEPPPPPSRARFWPQLAGLPRPAYLIKGVLYEGTLAEIFGPWGCGKSFLATDIGLYIAAGWDWNGRRVRQAGVLYANAEGGAAIVNRLDAWRRHHRIDLAKIAFAVVIEPTNLLDPAGVGQVLADAAAVPDLGLIVIDTAARVMPGGDEGPDTMSTFVAACDRIRAETGAAVQVVHHSGKDASRGSRGSTVLPASADTVIEVSRDANTGIATAHLDKQRDGTTGPLLNFTLEVVEVGTDEDGDPITSCVIEPTDRKPAKTKSLSAKQRRALDVLNNVIADHGEPAPDTVHYPAGVRVVVRDLWRESLTSAGVIDKDSKNPSRDFGRIKDQFAERGMIREWDGLIWAVPND